jgi:hypothetical protein
MNTNLVSKNQLIQDLNDAQLGFINSASQTMEYAFKIGEILSKLKEITPHGQFENVIKNDTRVAFGVKQAQRLMRIAAHRAFILEKAKGEALSLREMDKLISSTKQVQKPAMNAEVIDDGIPVNPENRLSILGKAGQEEILEGEFTEIPTIAPEPPETASFIDQTQPEPKEAPEQPEEPSDSDVWRDMVYELQSQVDALTADNERMRIVLEDDNHIVAAMKEVKRLTDQNRVLSERINGLMAEKNEAIKSVRYWKKKAEQLEKQIEEISHE